MSQRTLLILVLVACVVAGYAPVVAAQAAGAAAAPPSNVDSVIDTMRAASVVWMGEMLRMAGYLYGTLFVMEWTVRSGFLALQGSADVKAVFVLFFQLLLRRGAWGGIISGGALFLPSIVRGFHEAGIRAGSAAAGAAGSFGGTGGQRAAVTPQALAEGVFDFAAVQWEKMSIWTPDFLKASSSILAAAAIVVIAFALCSLFTWLVYIRAYLKFGGAILLGFGGSSVTEHIAKSYLQSLVSAGVSLMMIELVKSLCFPFLNAWMMYARQDPAFSLQTSWRMSLGGFVIAVCIISIPGVSQSMVSGGGGGQTAEGMTLAGIWTAIRAASGVGSLAAATGAASSAAAPAAAAATTFGGGGLPPPIGGTGGSGAPPSPSPAPLSPAPSGGAGGGSASTAAGRPPGGAHGGGGPTATGSGPWADASGTPSAGAPAPSSLASRDDWTQRIGSGGSEGSSGSASRHEPGSLPSAPALGGRRKA